MNGVAPQRSEVVLDAFHRSRVDGSVLVVHHPVGDPLVDGTTIRGLAHVLCVAAAAEGMATLQYSLAGLVRPLTAPGGPTPAAPSGIGDRTPPTVALDILRQTCLRATAPHLVIVDFAEHLLPPGQDDGAAGDTARIVEQIAATAVDQEWIAGGHRLVLVGRTGDLDAAVTRLPGVDVVAIALPDQSERRAALELMECSPRHPLHLGPDLDLARAARLTGGMSLQTLSTMRMHTSVHAPLAVSQVLAHKQAALRQAGGDTLVVHDEPLSLEADVAGMPQVRLLLDEELRRGSMSLRVILAGPPGNGKTRVSTAIAGAMGVPAIEFGHILNRYVGDSEANLRRALDAISANAPCLVILDEVDETFLGRRGESVGGDGGQVTANLRAALFSWLGDVGAQNGISAIGLTNRPDRLDEAATDRMVVLPVLHPSPLEAAQIMAIQARRQSIGFDLDGAARALEQAGSAFSGRQSVRLLGRAQVHSLTRGSERIEGVDVAAAIAESMQSIGMEEERQSLLAIRATSWAGHLPWNAARTLGDDSAAVPVHLARFVRPDGTVDLTALDDRLDELAVRRGR